MNLVKYTQSEDQITPAVNNPVIEVATLEAFNQMMNEQPPADEIEINKMAANSKYLPISVTQMLLDQIYLGMWQTVNFKSSVVANEITGTVTLKVFHPFAKIWIEREGSAAVMIQQSKNPDGSPAAVTDIERKIKNTLQKDYPHLLASCICSAARTLGKRFGRDLNRKIEDSYESFYGDIADSEAVTGAIDWDSVKTLSDLKNIWLANPGLQGNKNFIKTFTYHKVRIQTKK